MENNNVSAPTDVPVKESKFKENLKGAWDLIKFAALALAIVLPIRMWIAQPFVVNGLSMFPTFHDGDYLIVDEISYIVKGPKRGDAVVFKYPNDPSRYFIKRIIAMPNEKILINNGAVTIVNAENPDGFTLEEKYVNDKFDTTKAYETGADEYFVMGDNRNHSSDSRAWGILPRKLMIGRAYLRLLPFDNMSYLPGDINKVK